MCNTITIPRRVMYFTDWGTGASIESASMDGTNRHVIHSTSLTWPNALTLDIPSQVLYWADASLDKVESSNVDGSNRRVLARIGVDHPFGIVFDNNVLYFTDWTGNVIKRLSASGGSITTHYRASAFSSSTIFGIQVVDPARQPTGKVQLFQIRSRFRYLRPGNL